MYATTTLSRQKKKYIHNIHNLNPITAPTLVLNRWNCTVFKKKKNLIKSTNFHNKDELTVIQTMICSNIITYNIGKQFYNIMWYLFIICSWSKIKMNL